MAVNEKEMSFLEHLEELRWRIIKSVIGIVFGSIIVGIFVDFIVNNILFAPAKNTNPPLTIINLKPYGQFLLYMEVVLIGGVVLSVPNIIYQLWKFVEPALKSNEKKYVTSVVIFTSVCFLAGIVFAYYTILPANEYMSFVLSLTLASGLVFELPMVSFFLSKIGILKPAFMRKYRRHAIVIILLIAGIVTPGPDITSQILLSIPLLFLYEVSILICKYSQKKVKE
jgi:sec-independent protein translocase protein TatC